MTDHSHDHHHDHGKTTGLWHRVTHVLIPHGHDSADKTDSALEGSREGLRALWISLGLLGITALAQAAVFVVTGSIALLSDTLHNVADALTAVPLGIAFLLGRKAANRRFNYGYGRAEDLAGIVIVCFIAASAFAAGYAAINRLRHPDDVSLLWAVAAAGVIGFIGNEAVARYRMRVGRRIGSAALVADGLHARADGYTSLAVVVGAIGLAVGWDWVDPVIGLAIALAILFILKDAAVEIYRRMMDAVDPALISQAETALAELNGVRAVGSVRMRWVGHRLYAEVEVIVSPELQVTEAHDIAVEAEHELLHSIGHLERATVHTDPDVEGAHRRLEHHR
ncbi:cation diffusion facilitator family transporter [Haloglycomyces albus]|uniref:cation diffusion facilitator family transporter n=1 Tax=Haloglycomyces albus TaxID=526067 RepID=UPI00046CFD03|nr:cation diffusion facilitator family transporter [Haloglycomyces albus]